MPDPLEMAEGAEKLEELISQGPPRVKRSGRDGDPKAAWKPTNVRMDPLVKHRLKIHARAVGVPMEELVHLALVRFLDGLDDGEKLEPRPVAMRHTLL